MHLIYNDFTWHRSLRNLGVDVLGLAVFLWYFRPFFTVFLKLEKSIEGEIFVRRMSGLFSYKIHLETIKFDKLDNNKQNHRELAAENRFSLDKFLRYFLRFQRC